MKRTLNHTAASFKEDTGGNVAMMFSVTALTLIVGIGAAVDYGSASSRQQSPQDMVDAATLAAAKSNSTDQSELEAIAAKVVAQHNEANNNITLDVSLVDGQVLVIGHSKYDTHIMKLAGKPEMAISASAASPIAALTPVKIALVLDTTDSMSGDVTALKLASNALLDEIEEFVAPVAVSVVPFGQYVNVGTNRKGSSWLEVSNKDGTSETSEYCYPETRTISPRVCTPTGRMITYPDIRDGRNFGDIQREETSCTGGETELTGQEICEMRTTTYAWNGCVGSRQAPYNEQAAFGTNWIEGVLNVNCGSELQELTTSLTQVRSTISSLTTAGNTYLPSGVMWGWRTLQDAEPLKSTVDIKLQKDTNAKPVKVMVFMTDGANTKTQGGSEPHRHEGSSGPAADEKTRAICEAAKADGIQIYTIGYRMSSSVTDAKDVLIDCATSPSHYKDADSASELKAVFKELAGSRSLARLAI